MPLLIQLHILQLEQYSLKYLFRWWLKHPLAFSLSQKKPLNYTTKIKILLILISSLYIISFFFNPILLPIFLVFPLPLISISLLLFRPFEYIKMQQVITQVQKELRGNPKLTTVAITGSFGKTSTKNFLHFILNHHQFTLKTPESYNTLFSLAKVVNLELTRHHRYFIPEFAAYQPGDITKLAHMIPPKYSIITGIGNQHIERFGSLEKITQTKLELAQATTNPKQVLINLDSCPINTPCLTYSLKNPAADFYISRNQLKPSGLDFTLIYQNKSYHFTTPLFGTSNLYNLTAAISMALILKVPPQIIKTAVAAMPQSPHRLELKPLNHATLIDNTYSSNQTGFTQILTDLKKLPGKKAIITPGLVELGSASASIHQQLGKHIAKIFDTIVLVGHNSRTKNLHQGIGKHPNLSYLANHQNYWPTVEKLSRSHSWMLLENDLPDNY